MRSRLPALIAVASLLASACVLEEPAASDPPAPSGPPAADATAGDVAAPTPETRPAAGTPIFRPPNFSWVIDGRLGGMAHPGYGPAQAKAAEWVAERDVTLWVSLTLTPVDGAALAGAGLRLLHLPVKDFTPPAGAQMDAFVEAARRQLDAGGALVVQCGAGKGRTGTMLAAWFIAEGMSADHAIAHVRRLRPGSIETRSQEEALAAWAAARAGAKVRPTVGW